MPPHGCAQLPVDQRRGIAHHLIDVRDILEDFSVGDFYDLSRPVTEDILRVRVRPPLRRAATHMHAGAWMRMRVDSCTYAASPTRAGGMWCWSLLACGVQPARGVICRLPSPPRSRWRRTSRGSFQIVGKVSAGATEAWSDGGAADAR